MEYMALYTASFLRIILLVSSRFGEPNSITQNVTSKGSIDRNYYDENGRQCKQISNNGRGERIYRKYGKNGEHVHTYVYDKDGRLIGRPDRELNDTERMENDDIL